MDTSSNGGFDAMVRFRAPARLTERLKRIGKRKLKKLPEMGREALLRYVETEEKRLEEARG